jgi:tetratricopeptide (TPR) repeat protein
MNWIDIVLIILIVGSLAVLLFLAVRKAPQLSIVDPLSSKEAKTREKKKALLEERMTRQAEEKVRAAWKGVRPSIRAVQDGFRRFAGKLTALDRRYVERQRRGAVDAAELRHMIDEAKDMISAERYDVAEKTLIAVVSHDPKNAAAYELLGRMYLAEKQYTEAREALEFLLKISPKDASVLAAVGEVYEAQGDVAKAFVYYGKAKEVSPNNPKYLDFYIHAAIEARDFMAAQQALDHLEDVNSDNQKIPEFKEMIAEARKQ